MIPASLDSGHRMIADTLVAFRAGPALRRTALRPAPQAAGPLYIGIAGAKHAGKDTLANGLASALALPCDSFAAPLRALAELIPQQLMQSAGTGSGRDCILPELRVRALFARLPAGGLVPDVRLANEARAIRRRGGVVIRVRRPGHADEQPLPDDLVDIEVNNDGAPADLVRRTLDQLLSRGVI
ncbi:TPA: hypothetical protein UME25_004718 [Stenotrophomonas maltophilia]|uniref:hypothetical protein n=1 Tax=Stenotrophomonas TaxID=40323 RepID=UPI00066D2C6F|nr:MULTISPECIES: hypothetical protein [Stenotrophomonas]MDQ7280428.1 hypothetical protein [Stenotrophomonas sp. Sm6012]HEL3178894.1 hypothetical protein [Stenotrophomonas maltophilia]HEL3182526.1 hypothetical protein [Stenotrophomonas maltophilia]